MSLQGVETLGAPAGEAIPHDACMTNVVRLFSTCLGDTVATQTVAPASASALAIANPKPSSSATPATRARRPVRSILSIPVI